MTDSFKELDCRNMDCPAPVLETKKCIESGRVTRIRVIVDNDAAVENVSRFLTYNKFEVGVDSDGSTSAVEGTRTLADGPAEETEVNAPLAREGSRKTMILIGSNRMGRGDDELGEKLMINYIKTLTEMGPELWRLVFVNHGVSLAVNNSPVLDTLKELAANQVSILVCGTCLTHLNLMDQKAIGETTNMLDIVTSTQNADLVITL